MRRPPLLGLSLGPRRCEADGVGVVRIHIASRRRIARRTSQCLEHTPESQGLIMDRVGARAQLTDCGGDGLELGGLWREGMRRKRLRLRPPTHRPGARRVHRVVGGKHCEVRTDG